MMNPYVTVLNPDVESAVLGRMLLNPFAIINTLEPSSELFAYDGHRLLFDAIQVMNQRDYTDLAHRVSSLREFPGPGAHKSLASYFNGAVLVGLIARAATDEELPQYVLRLRQMANLRALYPRIEATLYPVAVDDIYLAAFAVRNGADHLAYHPLAGYPMFVFNEIPWMGMTELLNAYQRDGAGIRTELSEVIGTGLVAAVKLAAKNHDPQEGDQPA